MKNDWYGPSEPVSEMTHSEKYRGTNESFYDMVCRIIGAVSDNEEHRRDIKMTLLDQAFLPAGRIQRAVGAPHQVTPFNCFVSRTIEDSTDGIFDSLKEAFKTMRMGGGIGYDFSSIRPRGSLIVSQGQPASGAVSFMFPFDSTCKTVSSAGNRRGAQMGVLRVDHPDIEEFVHVKQNRENLTAFNISVAVTNEFMEAVRDGTDFQLVFKGEVRKVVNARALWDAIMRSNWDWAEPGVLFIDRINDQNNLWYCEDITATNPCGEQPLPPYGACLLGSFNMVKYVKPRKGRHFIDLEAFAVDIPGIVRMIDNVIETAKYPLAEQEVEAKAKRRMGLGVTGLANAIEACGLGYATPEYIRLQSKILRLLRDTSYRTSVQLAKEKGAFPLFERDKYLRAPFIRDLPDDVRDGIVQHGIRNSHLTSIAPTGTISLSADNISSGVEPVFSYEYTRTIITEAGPAQFKVEDYGVKYFNTRGRTADQISPQEHVAVLCAAQKFIDSACSKTCNIGKDVSWDDFKKVYMDAWEGGAKGCTTYRDAGKREGILKAEPVNDACSIDPDSGQKSCG